MQRSGFSAQPAAQEVVPYLWCGTCSTMDERPQPERPGSKWGLQGGEGERHHIPTPINPGILV